MTLLEQLGQIVTPWENKDGHNGVDGLIALLMRIVENELVHAEDISVPENGVDK